MKNLVLFLALTIGALTSCNKKCHCTQNWDSTITYVKGDLVNYNGQCWVAVAQGRGITPGPWQQNGNDIWQECAP